MTHIYHHDGRPMKESTNTNTDQIQAMTRVLLTGNISDCKLILEGSNYTFLVTLENGLNSCQAIYKPKIGENPLWDFPDGTLYKREYSSYLVAQAMCWHFIPCTVVRDGPYGVGSFQQFIQSDQLSDYFSLREEFDSEMKKIALFDYITNNADRKASHFLVDHNNCIWSIDHGLTFHTDPKLRTVVWDFIDQPIQKELLHTLDEFYTRLNQDVTLNQELGQMLHKDELIALKHRTNNLISSGYFPLYDFNRRNFPWPIF